MRPRTPEFSEPRSAYVHVPFCAHRCGYCDFTVIAGRNDLICSFLRALELELEALGQPRPLDTLYVGGGTPTHLPAEQLTDFLNLLAAWFQLDEPVRANRGSQSARLDARKNGSPGQGRSQSRQPRRSIVR